MNPDREFVRWTDEDAEIYAAFDRIFDCRGHGWSNLQSVHVNLPFAGDAEFARLHEAIRLVLPIIPALSAASPVLEGRIQPELDARLRFYASNARRIPEMTGRVVPEPVRSRREYEAMILEPLYRALAPHDPKGILRHEWANARGAIARFDRDAIEIRIVDAQECPQMDLALAAAIVAAVKDRTEDPGLRAEDPLETERLARIFDATARDADRATVDDAAYLRRLGLSGGPRSAADVWAEKLERTGLLAPGGPWATELGLILDEGPLARRLLAALSPEPSRAELAAVYRRLRSGLEANAPFHPGP